MERGSMLKCSQSLMIICSLLSRFVETRRVVIPPFRVLCLNLATSVYLTGYVIRTIQLASCETSCLKHDYIFKRIFRIDVCYDFEYFDSGDQPERFARRYLNRVYRKINQCRISAFGEDSWNDFAWETISWGNKSSMVSTKMYNKTKGALHIWLMISPTFALTGSCVGPVDNPVECTKRRRDGSIYKPDIWRVEFSMKSAADNWLVIEDIAGKKPKKRAIRHSLSMFDSREKLWQRFQDLAYHYFHFKYREYKDEETAIARIALNSIAPPSDKELKRKDRCRDKVLFHWDKDHEFLKVQALPSPSKASQDNDILLRRLRQFKCTLTDPKLSNACTVLIEFIEGLAGSPPYFSPPD